MEMTYEQLKEECSEAKARLTLAQAEIEKLQTKYQPQAMVEYFTPFVFILAIVSIFCYTSIRKAKIKTFGSVEAYKEFMEWKKNRR